MTSQAEQSALKQALDRLSDLVEFPSQSMAVLDASGHDVDVSNFFIQRGCETARVWGEGGSPAKANTIDGTAAATGLPAASLDMVVVAGARAQTCDRDVLFESSRILKPQACILLCYAVPVCLPGTVAALSENLALQFNPFWMPSTDPHAISMHLSHLAMSGFVGAESHTLDVSLPFSCADWVSLCCKGEIIQDARLSPTELEDFRLVLRDYIHRDFGSGNFFVPYRTLTYVAYRAN